MRSCLACRQSPFEPAWHSCRELPLREDSRCYLTSWRRGKSSTEEGGGEAVAAPPTVATSLPGRYHAPLAGTIYAAWRPGAPRGAAWSVGIEGRDSRTRRRGGGDASCRCRPTAIAHTNGSSGSTARSGG